MVLSFEQWLRRPVYVAQCRSWRKAAELGLCSVLFRARAQYRTPEVQRARTAVAQALRRQRLTA